MKKIDIGIEMLSIAIDLYLEGKSYISSLHLAGAAEELLGSYSKELIGKSAFQSDFEATSKIHNFLFRTEGEKISKMIMHPKNSAKHMDNMADSKYPYEAKAEAEKILERAIRNFYLLLDIGFINLEHIEKIEKYTNLKKVE